MKPTTATLSTDARESRLLTVDQAFIEGFAAGVLHVEQHHRARFRRAVILLLASSAIANAIALYVYR